MSKPLQSQTVADLRVIAKSLGLRGYSRLRKPALIEAIAKAQARPVAVKPSTVASLKAECRRRGLVGWSKLNKAGLESLLANTAKLAAPAPSIDEQIRRAQADLAKLDDARVLNRIMFENNSGRPACQADLSHWRRLEAQAVKVLRDSTECERTRRELANRYVSVTSGVTQ